MMKAQPEYFDSGADTISNLPVDKNPPSHNEIQLIDTFFKSENKFTVNAIVEESKDSIIIAFLFIILSSSQIDSLFHKILPMTVNSTYILIIIKALVIGAAYWLIKHFYLSKSA